MNSLLILSAPRGPIIMIIIANANEQQLAEHMARCEACQACGSCRTENCASATLMIEAMLPPGRVNDPAR